MIVTCHCFFHPAKKLRSGAIVRFSDNSSLCLTYLLFVCADVYHNYEDVVPLILEWFSEVVQKFLCFLNKVHTIYCNFGNFCMTYISERKTLERS